MITTESLVDFILHAIYVILGNSIVPQMAMMIFQQIKAAS